MGGCDLYPRVQRGPQGSTGVHRARDSKSDAGIDQVISIRLPSGQTFGRFVMEEAISVFIEHVPSLYGLVLLAADFIMNSWEFYSVLCHKTTVTNDLNIDKLNKPYI